MQSKTILSSEEVKWAATKWNNGYTIDEIAEALYVCTRTVRRALKIYGYNKVKPILEYKG